MELFKENICEEIVLVFHEKGLRVLAEDLLDQIMVETKGDYSKSFPKGHFDGLVLNYFYKEGIWEVMEYQAGNSADKLFVYSESKTLGEAVESFLKGNKRKPIKVW